MVGSEGAIMTEAEWLACTDPQVMLDSLAGRASSRKLRLFACACCRRIWPLLVVGRSVRAVKAAEGYADGLVDRAALAAANSLAPHTGPDNELEAEDAPWLYDAANAAHSASLPETGPQDMLEIAQAVSAHTYAATRGANDEDAVQSAHLRDIFGNPFRRVKSKRSWRTWNGGTVPKLAQVIYDERRFHDLPVLADALEEAGCADEDILAHCRQPGEHVRGCWVIDLLLGKD
jgi:hypothetical protein